MIDPVTEECRRVRDETVDRAGSFDNYFDMLEKLDRQRLVAQAGKGKSAAKSKTKPKKKTD